MPFFSVLLRGKGVYIPAEDGRDAIVGFYTTRVVKAASHRAAEADAIALVFAEWSKPPLSMQNKGETPGLIVEQVSAVTMFKALLAKNKGFTFYSHE